MLVMKQEPSFWIAIFITVLLRIAVSFDKRDALLAWLLKAVMSVCVGLFSAVVFTDAVISYRGLDPQTFSIPVGVLIAFTAESIVRLIVNVMPKDARAMKDILDAFKGWRS